jgi:enoyl-CoA hydratase/carnithine racemase
MSTNAEETVLDYQVANRVATITLNAPQRGNALSIAILNAFRSAIETAQKDYEVDVLILRSTGRHFCTGADLKWAGVRDENIDVWREGNAALMSLLRTLYVLDKPVLARVQGSAFGGAVAVLALCDEVVAVSDAAWKLPELQLGMVPSAIIPVLRLAVDRNTMRRVLCNESPWNSVDAHRFGLVTELASPDTLDPVFNARVEAWRRLPTPSFQATKRWLRELDENDFNRSLELGCVAAASF